MPDGDLEEKDALNKTVCYAIKRIEKNIAPQYKYQRNLIQSYREVAGCNRMELHLPSWHQIEHDKESDRKKHSTIVAVQ
ncbi:hypothetical protein LTR92_006958 [Exophiala xenobiotica]|nr:hypothetical protein LTR92_006958 [Exophiala xenobiotica]KAK5553339.1 hypothetical protein LTR46_008698 [Exophiala xenobiotica]